MGLTLVNEITFWGHKWRRVGIEVAGTGLPLSGTYLRDGVVKMEAMIQIYLTRKEGERTFIRRTSSYSFKRPNGEKKEGRGSCLRL